MTNERDEVGSGTITLLRSRDRASQIDFLRELSLARRATPVLTEPEPAAETRWTMDFAPADEEGDAAAQSLPDVSGTDDSNAVAWGSSPIEAVLSPSNWFDDARSEPAPEPASEPAPQVLDLFGIHPVSTWSDPNGFEAPAPSDTGAGDAAMGLFDLLPATTWPGLVANETELPDTSTEVEEMFATNSWVLDGAKPEIDREMVPAPTTWPSEIDITSQGLEHLDAAAAAFADTDRADAESNRAADAESNRAVADTDRAVADTDGADADSNRAVADTDRAVADRVDAPPPAVVLGNRPPTITATTPVVAHCSGVVASRVARGRRHTVLSGIELTVRSGEVAVITGRSGSGKTTLLECLAGLHRIDAGTISVGETSLREATEEQIADLRATTIGYVAQEPQLLADLSAVENIELPLLLSGWGPAEARTEAEAAVSLLQLQDPTSRASELSCGERRRVAIARSLVGEPAILWLDEPSAAIDPHTMAEIYELIFELCHDGLTVVAVTHDPVMLAYATSTYELRDGSLHPVVA